MRFEMSFIWRGKVSWFAIQNFQTSVGLPAQLDIATECQTQDVQSVQNRSNNQTPPGIRQGKGPRWRQSSRPASGVEAVSCGSTQCVETRQNSDSSTRNQRLRYEILRHPFASKCHTGEYQATQPRAEELAILADQSFNFFKDVSVRFWTGWGVHKDCCSRIIGWLEFTPCWVRVIPFCNEYLMSGNS